MKTPLRTVALSVSVILLVGLVSACGEPPDEPQEMVDSGSWYSRNQWPHDGKPYESPHIVVYSDASSPEAKQALAEVAEEVLVETITEMGVDPETMFRFPPGQDRIHIYANRNNQPDWGGGARGYYGGLIIWSLDHEAERRRTDLEFYKIVLKHELVHVVELLLKGRDTAALPGDSPQRVPTWFSEGMAEALVGGTTGPVPRTLGDLNDLTDRFGQRSPVAFRVDTPPDETEPGLYQKYHYPMSQLAVEYLIDPDGLGKSPTDFTAIFLDLADGAAFATAFEDHMGISLSDYEEQFFDLMVDYLPPPEPDPFPVAWIIVGIVVVGAALVLWQVRRRRGRDNALKQRAEAKQAMPDRPPRR